MRGALCLRLINVELLGIIPAYAGSTRFNPCKSYGSRDHPRVCGEHLRPRGVYLLHTGSSPRMRGAHVEHVVGFVRGGIIPAYAGSTDLEAAFSDCVWDHPRVCGEHAQEGREARGCTGSSPRMRGALRNAQNLDCLLGIIPAYAGSTR